MTGLPEPYSATNAVGMPLTPSLTVKPAFLRTPISRAAERFTGRSAEEVIGQPLAVLPAALKKIVQETFASGKAIADRTIVLFPDAEEKKPVRANTSLCRDASERPLAVLAILAVILVVLPLVGMFGMMATGASCCGGMMGMSGNMMTGMSALGLVWMLAAAAIVIALIVLLVRGLTRV